MFPSQNNADLVIPIADAIDGILPVVVGINCPDIQWHNFPWGTLDCLEEVKNIAAIAC